ncbi:MAG: hypothetical protein CBE33_01425 [Candidatus Pelagibacter sp. TMED273]|nr:MAG: hypothetical protein CBE33_01425 [Candidatus Pelagibacter sp. TMED273]|tara:strand:- start:1101 stop:1859 length:759 start_codon:yes stop_codon:yes gene_type:complete
MATFLLKKSYRLDNLLEVKFNDLWDSKGVFTTMRLVGKPPKIILFRDHIKNLIKSTKRYKIKEKNLKNIIIKFLNKILSNGLKYDHLLRLAINKNLISISIRKRLIPQKNFKLKIMEYKRFDPKYKNLYYKKIIKVLNTLDAKKFDIALTYKNKLLETGTSNIICVKKNVFYSPKNNCYIGNTIKFLKRKIKINFQDISLKRINSFDEILLIGSGKAVTSVSSIEKLNWYRKSLSGYNKVNKIHNGLLNKYI